MINPTERTRAFLIQTVCAARTGILPAVSFGRTIRTVCVFLTPSGGFSEKIASRYRSGGNPFRKRSALFYRIEEPKASPIPQSLSVSYHFSSSVFLKFFPETKKSPLPPPAVLPDQSKAIREKAASSERNISPPTERHVKARSPNGDDHAAKYLRRLKALFFDFLPTHGRNGFSDDAPFFAETPAVRLNGRFLRIGFSGDNSDWNESFFGGFTDISHFFGKNFCLVLIRKNYYLTRRIGKRIFGLRLSGGIFPRSDGKLPFPREGTLSLFAENGIGGAVPVRPAEKAFSDRGALLFHAARFFDRLLNGFPTEGFFPDPSEPFFRPPQDPPNVDFEELLRFGENGFPVYHLQFFGKVIRRLIAAFQTDGNRLAARVRRTHLKTERTLRAAFSQLTVPAKDRGRRTSPLARIFENRADPRVIQTDFHTAARESNNRIFLLAPPSFRADDPYRGSFPPMEFRERPAENSAAPSYPRTRSTEISAVTAEGSVHRSGSPEKEISDLADTVIRKLEAKMIREKRRLGL